MLDHGAVTGLTFSDAGLPSTVQHLDAVVPAAKGILAALNDHHPDAIMVELGDGIMGRYGVDLLLKDAELMGQPAPMSSAPMTWSGPGAACASWATWAWRWIAWPVPRPTTAPGWSTSSNASGRRPSTPVMTRPNWAG